MYLEETFHAVREASLRSGSFVRCCVVSDAKGLGLAHVKNSKLMREVVTLGQTYYPELVQSVLVVRAPASMFALWKYGVSWILPTSSKQKISIVGNHFDIELEKVIDLRASAVYICMFMPRNHVCYT